VSQILQLSLMCLRIGTFVFGGGLVMVPLLEADVVHKFGWLTQREFVDAVALGQMTPGPLLVTATFVGYKVGGEVGGLPVAFLAATLATICMFLPSFAMTLAASNHLSRLQGNRYVANFLWGVRAAVVGLVVAAALSIAQTTCGNVEQAALAVGAVAVLFYKNYDAGLVVLVCGALGMLLWSA